MEEIDSVSTTEEYWEYLFEIGKEILYWQEVYSSEEIAMLQRNYEVSIHDDFN